MAHVSLLAIIAGVPTSAFAQTATTTSQIRDGQLVVVTGLRMPRPDLTSARPGSVASAQQISLDLSVTIEDVSSKLPQLAGGVKSTAVSSNAMPPSSQSIAWAHRLQTVRRIWFRLFKLTISTAPQPH